MPISFDCEARSLASSASCRSRCMSGTPCLLCEAFCKRKLQCLEVRRQQTQSFSLHPVSEVRVAKAWEWFTLAFPCRRNGLASSQHMCTRQVLEECRV